jgi:hypothetical protein
MKEDALCIVRKETPMTTTCQICGREIKAKKGIIAHHGYQRPGQGWQTSSCFGARWRPYEVACDALPPAIESCERFIAMQEVALAALITSPPATMSYNKNARKSWLPSGNVDVPKPENFDHSNPDYSPNSYWHLYNSQKEGHESHIKMASYQLADLKKRLADWKAPQEAA